TEWHNIVAWRNSADVAEKFIRKGTQVYIEGKLRTRSWTDQSGNKRFTTEVTVDNLQLLGKSTDYPAGPSAPATGPGNGYQQQSYQPQPQQPAYQQPAYQPQPQQPKPAQQEAMDISLGDNPTDDLPF
ncbi:MAG: single-stranded DNA-binding protein, partial [Bacteroidales bacterium]|nr:single-stranded DNA-binding protein [Bacteroidales bacterium]